LGLIFLTFLGVSFIVHLAKTPRPKRPVRNPGPCDNQVAPVEPGYALIDEIDDTKIANDAFIDRAIDFMIAAGLTKRQAEKLVTETHAKMIPGSTLRELIIKCVRNMKRKKRKAA
jgi:hypothetical protein